MKRALPLLRRIVFWSLPVVILGLIFQKIDVVQLQQSFAQANGWLVAAGLAYYPLVVGIGALRWRTLLGGFVRRRVEWRFALRHYWIGLALGMFGPASIGWDVYRIAAGGRRYNAYRAGAAAILTEKLLALLTSALLVVLLYPLLAFRDPGAGRMIFLSAGVLLATAGAGLWMLQPAGRWVDRLAAFYLKDKLDANPAPSISAAADDRRRTSTRPLTMAFLLSLLNLLMAAIGNQIFFRAVHCPLPFAVNLFVLPVLYFIFLLPISFGSLGIREGAYILLYGLFGVPAETALVVSFFNLLGVLLNNLIGALLAPETLAGAAKQMNSPGLAKENPPA